MLNNIDWYSSPSMFQITSSEIRLISSPKVGLQSGLRGSGKIVRIRILFEKSLRIRIRNGSGQFQKIDMKSHEIHIFSWTDIAIPSKLLYFGNLLVYKRNLPQKSQNICNFFVILRTKSKKIRDFHKNLTDLGKDLDP